MAKKFKLILISPEGKTYSLPTPFGSERTANSQGKWFVKTYPKKYRGFRVEAF